MQQEIRFEVNGREFVANNYVQSKWSWYEIEPGDGKSLMWSDLFPTAAAAQQDAIRYVMEQKEKA